MAYARIRLLFLLSCVTSPEVLGDILRPSCASGWFYFKSSCYGYFRKLRNWSDAELECQSYGNTSHLASVLSVQEARVAAKYIAGYQRTQPVWIGLHNPHEKQQWQWTDGATYAYSAWTNRTASGGQQCAETGPRGNFLTWNPNLCSKRHHFLCKYRP
ncbi:regenerating islet-derived protein 4 [Perognathus longimembris pacificus]|uniref:regenerating islet-derived protein 4 n=1 Tax=Perognathus longimembris pacificus TaxID=214514 RepID=UPI002018CE1F|nr:regenerating islet-derived protein 4 [Perognathus longimembris pacificus]